MARQVRWGTPGKSDHYPPLRNRWVFLGPALLLGAAAMGLLFLFWIAGFRTPVAPGAVIGQHANIEARCEECHTPRAGVSDTRCQRCHDPAGAGRLNNAAHVLFGSGDPRKAAAAPRVDCAHCHIDHRGRSWALTRVDEGQCSQCHFRTFSAHPQFAVLRNHSTQAPGIRFPHDKHVAELAKQGVVEKDSCIKCHEPSGPTRDLEPISFDRHCASCHAKEGSVGPVEPIPQALLIAPDALAAQGQVNFRLDEFETSRSRINKTFVRHKDDWVLANLRKMRRDIDPEGCAVERGALLARESQLRRKLALSAPLAGLDLPALQGREAALDSEIKGAEARIRAQGGAADPPAGLARLDEVFSAVARSGDAAAKAEATRLRGEIEALRGATAAPAGLPVEDVEARKSELLALLDAVEAADPALRARAEDLRRRLLAFNPGEVGVEMLARVRDQRMAERARVRDEIILRQAGIASPPAALLVAEQRAIRDALLETRRRLREIGEAASGTQALAGEAKAASLQALGVLTAACQKCHILDGPTMLPVRPANPVLARATFVHAPHLLQADCARCHAGVERSKQATELNFKGVESCQECHRPRRVRQDCQSCHRYHPRAMP
jgi:hypothetical protein